MTMGRYLCQLCYTIVEYGDRHPCFFYKDDDTVYTVPKLDETKEVDINHDETTGEYSQNPAEIYWDKFETTQQTRNTSQASTSRVDSVPSEGKQEVDEISKDSMDRPVPLQASLHAAHRQREMDAEVKQPIELKQDECALPGPSAIPSKTIGPGGKTLYACDLCSYSTKKKTNFENHYRTHTGEKPFDCDFCVKKFTTKGNLNEHLRMHTGEMPYVCETCGKGYTSKRNLNYHRRNHTE